jgi:retron-type reverse transcriptase
VFYIKNGLKQGDVLSPILLNFALENAIRKDQVNHDYLKLNGTHQLLFYDDDVNILGRSIRAVKENKEAFLVGSK